MYICISLAFASFASPRAGSSPSRTEVQPCYDRKIEAARPHFEVSGDPESTLVGASRLAPGRVVGRPGLFGRVVQVAFEGV